MHEMNETLTLDQRIKIYSEMLANDMTLNELVLLDIGLEILAINNPKASHRLKSLSSKAARKIQTKKTELKNESLIPLAEAYLGYEPVLK